jgi:NTP pyrophosphatase (non-canonical NTP hydrolase)
MKMYHHEIALALLKIGPFSYDDILNTLLSGKSVDVVIQAIDESGRIGLTLSKETPMIEDQHRDLVSELAKDGAAIDTETTLQKAHLTHMALGVAGEAGEIVDAIKKHTIYDQPLDLENVIEELGDLEFYMEGIRHCLGLTRTQTLAANIEKLRKWYPAGYTSITQQKG